MRLLADQWREQLARIIGLALCVSILLSYWLIEHSDKVPIFNVFRYITFRTGAAIVTALVFMLLFLKLIRFNDQAISRLRPIITR